MKRGLLIAEKPSLMKAINSAYNVCKEDLDFELEFDSVAGHFMELMKPDEYDDKWKEWTLETLPIIPEEFKFVVKSNQTTSYNRLKKRLKEGNYDFVVNACDAGREGQAIFWSLFNSFGIDLPVLRIWIKDNTEEYVIKGLKSLIDESEDEYLINLKDSSFLRMELDWLIGMNLSRAITIQTNRTIPIGRVMTPTLKIVVDRDLEIKNFKPTTTYEVVANFEDKYEGFWFDKESLETRFETMDKANKFIEGLKGSKGIVEEVEVKRETNSAPANYSLGDLQKDANKYYGYTAQETLDIAQTLYDKHKYITYPRTDSRVLSTGLANEIENHIKSISEVEGLEEAVKEVLDNKDNISKIMKSKKYVNDAKLTDHHAIIPTKMKPNLNVLTVKEKNIYLLVAKRFISIFLKPFQQDKTTIITRVGNENFKTVGSVLVDLGYRHLYDYKKEDAELPKVNKGEEFEVLDFKLDEKISTPPAYFNDSSLISAMENVARFLEEEEQDHADILKEIKGIGTVATRAGIIEKLLARKLLVRKGKRIEATDFGLTIIDLLGDRKIASPILTAEWEDRLLKIEEGKEDKKQFKLDMNDYIVEQIDDIVKNISKDLGEERKQFEVIGTCPKCSREVIMTDKYYLCKGYKSKEEDPCDFVWKSKGKNSMKKKDMVKLLNGEVTDDVNMVTKDGKKFKTKFYWDKEAKKISFYKEVAEPIMTCPKCGTGSIVDKGNFYGCTNYSNEEESCTFSFPTKILNAKITPENLKVLLEGGTTEYLTFTSKKGSKFEAQLSINEEGKLDITRKPKEVIGKCPNCGGDIVDNGNFYGCSNYKLKECPFTIQTNILGQKITKDIAKTIIEEGESGDLTFTWKNGKKGTAKLKIKEDKKGLEFLLPKRSPVNKKLIGKCYHCGSDVYDYVTFVKCSNEDCGFSISKKLMGTKLTDKDIKNLLEGESTSLKTVTWKSGTKDKVYIKLKEGGGLDFIRPR